MGFLTSVVSKLFKFALFFILLAVLPGVPPHTEFEAFSVSPPQPLVGVLALNSRLNNAERLFEGDIHGPEALQVHNGQLYTSLHGGYVARVDKDTVKPVVKFGQECEGFHEEEKCGRPLGIAFDQQGKMYVADAYYGIFKVDPATGKYENLVSMNDVIEGRKPMLPNSLVVDKDGSIYWTDSSTYHHLHDGLFTCLASGNGRLIKYDPATKTNTVLLHKIHLANGIALSEDGSFVVICETVAHRLLKYHIKGRKAGQSEVFVDGLNGAPDNIRSDGKGGFIVSLILPRDVEHPSLIARLGPFPTVRKGLARLLYMVQSAVALLRDLTGAEILKKAAHLIGHFESLPPPTLKRASILFLTKDGKVSQSLYATDGLIGISDFIEYGGYYYLGSPFNRFLARVKAS